MISTVCDAVVAMTVVYYANFWSYLYPKGDALGRSGLDSNRDIRDD